MNLLDRLLWNTVIGDTDECWLWQGGKNNIGYGLIRDHDKMRTVHRVSYEEHNKTKIPEGKVVCHECDNILCVNPNHLWIGSLTENTQDMIAKGRHNLFGSKNKIKCKYCDIKTSSAMLSRWHNEKCRHKPLA